jgi:hypothetical protein
LLDKYKIGDIVIALRSRMNQGTFFADPAYQGFETTAPAQVQLEVFTDHLPDLKDWELVHDTGTLWRLYHQDGKWGYSLHSALRGDDPYQVAIFDQDFLTGSLYSRPAPDPGSIPFFPLRYPMAELLMTNLLARGRGVMLHACAVKLGQRGIVFAGTSGAGKSTIARLWQDQADAVVLNDDRVILRLEDDRFWVYGTPWHGDVPACSPGKAELAQIFIINHAGQNQLSTVRPVERVSRLLLRAFSTFWYPAGLEFTIGLLSELCLAVPCQDLGFRPDPDFIPFIRKHV